METLFISDLHLSSDRPDKLELFRKLLQGPARSADGLYILGDIFDQFWVGNDDQSPPNTDIIHELKAYINSGAKLFVLRGNRDLLIDQGFEELTGCKLLPDISKIELMGKEVLLMHGDLLCTKDWKYQLFRRFIDFPITRFIIGHLPYGLRIKLAHGFRPLFRQSTLNKPADIIDVDQDTVEQTMRTHNVTDLIHGHTHRPKVHEFSLDGTKATRIVLGDWYEEDQILVCRNNESSRMRITDYLNQH